MTNETLNRLLDLPNFCKRNQIYHAENPNYFGIRWMDRLIRTFEKDNAVASITYPITLYIESVRYSGELEVRRDGSHAVRMTH